MRTIHRADLSLEERQTVKLHFSSKVLQITNMRPQYQRIYARSKFEMWYTTETDRPEKEMEDREIIIIGTGSEIPPDARHHLGSVTSEEGTFVWHFFSDELKRAE